MFRGFWQFTASLTLKSQTLKQYSFGGLCNIISKVNRPDMH